MSITEELKNIKSELSNLRKELEKANKEITELKNDNLCLKKQLFIEIMHKNLIEPIKCNIFTDVKKLINDIKLKLKPDIKENFFLINAYYQEIKDKKVINYFNEDGKCDIKIIFDSEIKDYYFGYKKIIVNFKNKNIKDIFYAQYFDQLKYAVEKIFNIDLVCYDFYLNGKENITDFSDFPGEKKIEYILLEEVDPNIELSINYKDLNKNIEMKNRWKIKVKRNTSEYNIVELLKNLPNDKLIINGNEEAIGTYNSKNELTVFVFCTEICNEIIYVKDLTGKIFYIYINHELPCLFIKYQIWKQTGIPISQHRIIFDGKELNYFKLIKEYGIKKGSTFYLIYKKYKI